jgi:hypothetical protein
MFLRYAEPVVRGRLRGRSKGDLVKRFVAAAVSILTISLALWAGPASGQTEEPPTTEAPTTTAAPTTEAPATTEAPTPTVVAPEAPTTTLASPTTTEAPPVTIPPVDLPGEQVTSGTLTVGSTYHTKSEADCTLTGGVGGQEMNFVRDESGNIGAVYGRASLGGGDVGLLMIQLGPIPMAITAYRSTGACNQDVIGIGAFDATPTSAHLSSIGYSMYPDDYLDNVTVDLQVGGSQAPAVLDLQSAYDFLVAGR